MEHASAAALIQARDEHDVPRRGDAGYWRIERGNGRLLVSFAPLDDQSPIVITASEDVSFVSVLDQLAATGNSTLSQLFGLQRSEARMTSTKASGPAVAPKSTNVAKADDWRQGVQRARTELYAALQGGEGNVDLAAQLLDQLLEDSCPHDESDLRVSSDDRGHLFIVCDSCEASWYPTRNIVE